MDLLDLGRRNIVDTFLAEGLRVTALLYIPSGAIDIVAHEESQPCAEVIENLVRLHLHDARPTGGVQ
jgi:hypothetical protein